MTRSIEDLLADAVEELRAWKSERDRYRDALVRVICRGDAVARRIAEEALGVAPGQRTSGARVEGGGGSARVIG